jgi:hypothetical protein
MTFSHELQHFVQYGSKRKLWALGRLVPSELINSLGLNWPDIPHEKEARIVAKGIALKVCGPEAVGEYINRKIIESKSAMEAEDWRFSQQADPSTPYDLASETRQLCQRLKLYRPALEGVLREMSDDADFKDIDLSDYFDGAS